jgi:hypothetical protein
LSNKGAIPDVEQLFAFARTLAGKTLVTVDRGKSFKVAVLGASLAITPATGAPHITDRGHITELLHRLSVTGSYQSGKYFDVTPNAAYVLALVKLWQGST